MKHRRKNVVRILLWASVLAALLVAACDMTESVSIEERAQRFMRDLDRENYSNLYTHVHPDEAWRAQVRDPKTWEPEFPYGDYKYSEITVGSSQAGVTLTGTPAGSFIAGDILNLRMRRDGDVWYIIRIDRNGTEIFPAKLP